MKWVHNTLSQSLPYCCCHYRMRSWRSFAKTLTRSWRLWSSSWRANTRRGRPWFESGTSWSRRSWTCRRWTQRGRTTTTSFPSKIEKNYNQPKKPEKLRKLIRKCKTLTTFLKRIFEIYEWWRDPVSLEEHDQRGVLIIKNALVARQRC